jgi:hypothetical protein
MMGYISYAFRHKRESSIKMEKATTNISFIFVTAEAFYRLLDHVEISFFKYKTVVYNILSFQ